MDAFAPSYSAHNLPLVLLSGLGDDGDTEGDTLSPARQESGTRLSMQSGHCESDRARQLLQQFLKHDGSRSAWNAGSLPGPANSLRYSMKAIGRQWTLAPRKAAPPPQSPDAEGNTLRQTSPGRSTELHSPISPLSPGSPIFPDGVFTSLWFKKHQDQIPCLMLAFFEMKPGDDMSLDDQLKADISAVRAALIRSGSKTRFAAVLLSNTSIMQAPALEERLTSIRRVTSLDSKTGLFFMPPMSSPAEISTFVQSILTTLQPLCVEYYRDLTKHARRKKARSTIPAPTAMPARGNSQTLSTPGWNVRYEVKQGVFAEFRQEMDVAERHYSQAIDDLFTSEGVFETTPSWSPRWDEARLLCDALALRVIRCQLWNGLTSGAAQSWSNYRARMKDLIDRRGKGSQTYSWEAWESRWAKIMAELTHRADLPVFKNQMKQSLEDSTELAVVRTYATPEKAFPSSERLPPFHMLHHAGYWLRLAVLCARSRWKRALAIPEEDRIPPDRSPASAVANRMRTYDHYLVPDPHEEFALSEKADAGLIAYIGRYTEQAVREFASRGQERMVEQTKLNLGRDMMDAGRYKDALETLIALYNESSWRNDEWHGLFDELLQMMHECSIKLRDAELVLSTTWELLASSSSHGAASKIDLVNCLKDLTADSTGKIHVEYTNKQKLSPIRIQFAFGGKEGFVGEPLGCQITLTSHAPTPSPPITLSEVEIEVGAMKPIKLAHSDNSSATTLTALALEEQGELLAAELNLTLQPGQSRAFNLALTFREAREVQLKSVLLSVDTDRFKLRHSFSDPDSLQTSYWSHIVDGNLETRDIHRKHTTMVNVLPKPPKIQIVLNGLQQRYYVGEEVRLELEIINDEADIVNGTISSKTSTMDSAVLESRWQDGDFAEAIAQPLSELAPSAFQKLNMVVRAPLDAVPHTLTIDVDYTLASEPFTPLKKTMLVELEFATLFEVKFNFGPLLHTDQWPSYFDPDQESSKDSPAGIPQKWRAGCHVNSLATENIIVKNARVAERHIDELSALKCVESAETEHETIAPNAKFDRTFQVETQKISLDDRRPTLLELELLIDWSRTPDSQLCTTKLAMPRLTLPSSEPRVLCTIAEPTNADADVTLQYHLENPSTHFLTFALTMEANEDFAFSGPKYRTLSLAPLSRHHVEFQIVVHGGGEEVKEGRWIWPALQVVDSYYQKTLRVQAASQGVKVDPQRGLGVWIAK